MSTPPNNLSKNLTFLMRKRGLNPNSLAEKMKNGPPQATIFRIINGESLTPRDGTVEPLAAFFGFPVHVLRYSDLEKEVEAGTQKPFDRNVVPAEIGRRRIPVISYVQAGRMTEMRTPFSAGDVFEYLMTDLDLSDRAFALEIRGKSMEPDFREGDHALFDPELQPRPGDYVVAKNGKEEATFKKYRPRGTTQTGQEIFELSPLNDDFPTIRSDSQQITIIAVLVEHRRYLRRQN